MISGDTHPATTRQRETYNFEHGGAITSSVLPAVSIDLNDQADYLDTTGRPFPKFNVLMPLTARVDIASPAIETPIASRNGATVNTRLTTCPARTVPPPVVLLSSDQPGSRRRENLLRSHRGPNPDTHSAPTCEARGTIVDH